MKDSWTEETNPTAESLKKTTDDLNKVRQAQTENSFYLLILQLFAGTFIFLGRLQLEEVFVKACIMDD